MYVYIYIYRGFPRQPSLMTPMGTCDEDSADIRCRHLHPAADVKNASTVDIPS